MRRDAAASFATAWGTGATSPSATPRWWHVVICVQVLTPFVAAVAARVISNRLVGGVGELWREVPGQHDRYSFLAGEIPLLSGLVVLLASTGFGLFRCFRSGRREYVWSISMCGYLSVFVLALAVVIAAPHVF